MAIKKRSIGSKIIVTWAVATGMWASPMAQALETQIYGKVRISVDALDRGDKAESAPGAGDAISGGTIDVNAYSSRLGFKGGQELDGGLKFIWQLETDIKYDKGGFAGTTGRNSFGGLSGDFGTVLAGKHDTPYKLAGGKLDPFIDSRADHNSMVGVNPAGASHDMRASNILMYTSPTVWDTKFIGAYVADETPDNTDTPAISLAMLHGHGPMYASVAYQSLSNSGVGGDDDTAAKFAFGYNFYSGTSIGVILEALDAGGANGDRNGAYVSAKQKIGKHTLKAAYGVASDLGDDVGTGATYLAVGVVKKLGKGAELYAQYAAVNNDTNATYGFKGSGPSAPAAAAGEDVTAFSVGFNYMFGYEGAVSHRGSAKE